jgi:hypothetical protein
MLLLIDTQDPRDAAPEPSQKRGRLRFSRPGRAPILLILAVAIAIGGLLTDGLVSALLLFLSLLALCLAATTAMAYTAGLADRLRSGDEHQRAADPDTQRAPCVAVHSQDRYRHGREGTEQAGRTPRWCLSSDAQRTRRSSGRRV